MTARAIVIVLDGVGAGELPDADRYGDAGSDTLGHVAAAVPLQVPTLAALGLGAAVAGLTGVAAPARPGAATGRMAERSPGKDSVTGHWEMMGLVLERPFPTFPHGFPADLVADFEGRIGRAVLGNVVASGTAIIDELGAEHVRTGRPIVYTSADSVFQIAAHEKVVPVALLYEWCHVAFELAVEARGLGRVIARPFVGEPGRFERTANRHDFAMAPPVPTVLDELRAAGATVTGIGKVGDLFAGRGFSTTHPTASDADGMARLLEVLDTQPGGFVFVNLVDFDTKYGHRNDVVGFAANLERFDAGLPAVLERLQPGDLLVITADHGNDPATPSTDHSREYVPVLATGPGLHAASLGTRDSFADVGATVAEWLGVTPSGTAGRSFAATLRPPVTRR